MIRTRWAVVGEQDAGVLALGHFGKDVELVG